jgi:MFS family permease
LKKQKETQMFSAAVALLTLALLLLWYLPTNITTLIILVMMFFTAFNYLEATMPSILSRIAPAGVKGSVMGIYSSSQFLGAFAGGILGGFIAGEFGEQTIFLVTGLFALVWLFLTLGMKPLKKSKAYSFSTNINNDEQAHEVAQKLSEMPGVIEVTIMHDEAVAYLKVDDKTVDILSIKALLNE